MSSDGRCVCVCVDVCALLAFWSCLAEEQARRLQEQQQQQGTPVILAVSTDEHERGRERDTSLCARSTTDTDRHMRSFPTAVPHLSVAAVVALTAAKGAGVFARMRSSFVAKRTDQQQQQQQKAVKEEAQAAIAQGSPLRPCSAALLLEIPSPFPCCDYALWS